MRLLSEENSKGAERARKSRVSCDPANSRKKLGRAVGGRGDIPKQTGPEPVTRSLGRGLALPSVDRPPDPGNGHTHNHGRDGGQRPKRG